MRKNLINRKEVEYWKGSLFNDLIERIKISRYKNVKLLIYLEFEQVMVPQGYGIAPVLQDSIKRTEFFTSEPTKNIARQGFRRCVGFHDNIAWWGVKQYVKIIGGETFDIHEKDKNGNFKYCQFNAVNLHDNMKSNATMDFIKQMGKARMLQKMDLQKIAMIAIIALGAMFGLFLLT